jgi:methyltransferase
MFGWTAILPAVDFAGEPSAMPPTDSVAFVLFLAAIAFVPMLFEAKRSAANERVLRAAGATEPDADVYRVMQIAYPGCFLAMTLEAWVRSSGLTPLALAGIVVFVAAKALKYWAVAVLGERWSFRVLVPQGSRRIVRGPYMYVRHPNYIAVAGELAGFALIARAPISGLPGLALFAALMFVRIRVEERALGMRTR